MMEKLLVVIEVTCLGHKEVESIRDKRKVAIKSQLQII